MVQNFVVFVDRSAAAKIRTANFSSASYGLLVGVVSPERNLEPRNFLLKGWEAIPRKFAPAKISRYTVI